ncbi:MAG TPA: DUF222 domain-containing protein [Microlunatus sp.]
MSSSDRWTALIADLAALDAADTDPERVDQLTTLERVKSAVAAAQVRITDAFAVSQRAKLVKLGTDSADARRSITAQVGLARRDSPFKGGRHVGLADTLVHEMPGVLKALERGDTSEWRVTVVARETAHLSKEYRAEIDAAIADEMHAWGDARTEREVKAWAQRLDPYGAAERAAKAANDRRVSIRPAPDCMSYVTALLPVKDGCAVYGVLHRRAMAGAVDPNEHRGKGQIMADEFVRRILTPAEGEPAEPGIELHLVMTDRTLCDADTEPAQLVGYGPIPAPVARDLVRADDKTKIWVRRLYTDPTTGDLAATDARKRDFPEVARAFLTARDQICRTPWCGAPIRHADHAVAVAKGGETDLRNGNGRCGCCNLTKDLAGWATLVEDGTITTTTPTSHRHVSRPPKPPKSASWPTKSGAGRPDIRIELHWPFTTVRSRR